MTKIFIPIFAILTITAITIIALLRDINGTILTTAISLLAGLGGYTLAVSIGKEKK
ncbi:hypothetical protein ES705_27339 [subsurface metagenome]